MKYFLGALSVWFGWWPRLCCWCLGRLVASFVLLAFVSVGVPSCVAAFIFLVVWWPLSFGICPNRAPVWRSPLGSKFSTSGHHTRRPRNLVLVTSLRQLCVEIRSTKLLRMEDRKRSSLISLFLSFSLIGPETQRSVSFFI